MARFARGTKAERLLSALLLESSWADEAKRAAWLSKVLQEDFRYDTLGDSWAPPVGDWSRAVGEPLKQRHTSGTISLIIKLPLIVKAYNGL